MSESKQKFGELLTFAVRTVQLKEHHKTLEIIQDELGYAIGKVGGHTAIEYWRGGNIPSDEDLETLTGELAKRTELDRKWFEEFLDSAGYLYIERLCNELFESDSAQEDGLANSSVDSIESPPEHFDTSNTDRASTHTQRPVLPTAVDFIANKIIRYQRRLLLIVIGAVVVTGILLFFAAIDIPRLARASLCGETNLVEDMPIGGRFLAHQGVTSYTMENTPNGVLNNRVRAVEGTSKGALVGYFGDEANAINGLSYFNNSSESKIWANCNEAEIPSNKLVNTIFRDNTGRIWVGTDGDGILMFDGKGWHVFSQENGRLNSNAIYQLLSNDGKLWAATGEGVEVFTGNTWNLVFSDDDELYHNQIYSIAFDSSNNIWVGHIDRGLSLFTDTGGWTHITASEGGLGGNNIRGIIVRPADENSHESVWIATANAGVSKFEQGFWQTYSVKDGLPSLQAQTINIDRYNRVWVGTDKGVVYFDGANWIRYSDLNTLSIDFSSDCENDSCPEDDHVWTGTESFGLTHSRLPYPEVAMNVTQICFRPERGQRDCPDLIEVEHPHIITATYPTILDPGEKFYFEIEVTPRGGYELRQDRGDFLAYTIETDENLFGSWPIIPAENVISTGQNFIFSNRNNMFIAPDIGTAESESFNSTWRVWMHTRYTGPEIHIVFTVEQP